MVRFGKTYGQRRRVTKSHLLYDQLLYRQGKSVFLSSDEDDSDIKYVQRSNPGNCELSDHFEVLNPKPRSTRHGPSFTTSLQSTLRTWSPITRSPQLLSKRLLSPSTNENESDGEMEMYQKSDQENSDIDLCENCNPSLGSSLLLESPLLPSRRYISPLRSADENESDSEMGLVQNSDQEHSDFNLQDVESPLLPSRRYISPLRSADKNESQSEMGLVPNSDQENLDFDPQDVFNSSPGSLQQSDAVPSNNNYSNSKEKFVRSSDQKNLCLSDEPEIWSTRLVTKKCTPPLPGLPLKSNENACNSDMEHVQNNDQENLDIDLRDHCNLSPPLLQIPLLPSRCYSSPAKSIPPLRSTDENKPETEMGFVQNSDQENFCTSDEHEFWSTRPDPKKHTPPLIPLITSNENECGSEVEHVQNNDQDTCNLSDMLGDLCSSPITTKWRIVSSHMSPSWCSKNIPLPLRHSTGSSTSSRYRPIKCNMLSPPINSVTNKSSVSIVSSVYKNNSNFENKSVQHSDNENSDLSEPDVSSPRSRTTHPRCEITNDDAQQLADQNQWEIECHLPEMDVIQCKSLNEFDPLSSPDTSPELRRSNAEPRTSNLSKKRCTPDEKEPVVEHDNLVKPQKASVNKITLRIPTSENTSRPQISTYSYSRRPRLVPIVKRIKVDDLNTFPTKFNALPPLMPLSEELPSPSESTSSSRGTGFKHIVPLTFLDMALEQGSPPYQLSPEPKDILSVPSLTNSPASNISIEDGIMPRYPLRNRMTSCFN